MRVLILSCNTGGGHNACAGAIQAAFLEKGDHCEITDALGFVSEKLARFISWGHTTMYRHVPGLFRVGYGFAEKHTSLLEKDAAAYKLLTAGVEQLYGYLAQGKYDAVICTHVFSGLLLAQLLLEHPMPIMTAFVGTDYTCSPGTANSDLAHYFIPAADLTEEFEAQGVPRERIIPCGIPVRKEFYTRSDKAHAKRALKLDPDRTHLLMMCGSMGCGPLEKLAQLLHRGMDGDMELSIVCGTNEKLCSKLREQYAQQPNIHIHGFVADMSTMMDSAELYLTKPGGLSTTEAAAKDLPMVFVDAVAGCEAYNLQYFTRLGGAVTAETPEELSALCLALMRDKSRRAQMTAALQSLPNKNAAQCICNVLHADEDRAKV